MLKGQRGAPKSGPTKSAFPSPSSHRASRPMSWATETPCSAAACSAVATELQNPTSARKVEHRGSDEVRFDTRQERLLGPRFARTSDMVFGSLVSAAFGNTHSSSWRRSISSCRAARAVVDQRDHLVRLLLLALADVGNQPLAVLRDVGDPLVEEPVVLHAERPHTRPAVSDLLVQSRDIALVAGRKPVRRHTSVTLRSTCTARSSPISREISSSRHAVSAIRSSGAWRWRRCTIANIAPPSSVASSWMMSRFVGEQVADRPGVAARAGPRASRSPQPRARYPHPAGLPSARWTTLATRAVRLHYPPRRCGLSSRR